MSTTHGPNAKRKRFDWHFYVESNQLCITNENGLEHSFTSLEVHNILEIIKNRFGAGYFPLGNNVEKLGNGTEKMGLGVIILEVKPGDIFHAQGSSYLGVVLEECGYLQWNGKHMGIKWRLIDENLSMEAIVTRLSRF